MPLYRCEISTVKNAYNAIEGTYTTTLQQLQN